MPAVTVPIHSRWGDMDLFGHINNVAYVRYLEDARAYLIEQAGLKAMGEDYGHMVVRHEIDYVKQAEYTPDAFAMRVWVDSIGNASYVFGYELHYREDLLMKAKTTMVCMDMRAGRPGRIPEHIREVLAAAAR